MRNRRDPTSRAPVGPLSFMRIGLPAMVLGVCAALASHPSNLVVRGVITIDVLLLLALTLIVRRLLRERLA